MKNPARNSIRLQLLGSLLMPLGFLWIICAAVAFYLAIWFANDSYDHQLINSADSVGARIKSDGSRILVDLPPAAQAILRHNDRDRFYYQICKKDGTRISGDVLPSPSSNLDSDQPVLRYARLNGNEVRMVRIRVSVPNYADDVVLVQVAETLNSRHQLAQNILLSILIPELILIALGALAVWRGISTSLFPLKILERALETRNQLDLTPISESEPPLEVRPLVRAINRLFMRLSEDIESQQRFVANAAHQFRTPLAALKTYIYYAKRLPSDKKMNQVLDKIDAGTERMSHLSNKLLALAKAEPANTSSSSDPVDLNFVVSETVASFAHEAAKRNVNLEFVAANSPALLRGDANNLSELTANLVENAIFYTPPGGNVLVFVSAGEWVNLVVRDNGPGIPEEERSRVFERFYRLLGADSPGSGLGLAIVKEIATAHGAEISIESPPRGTGTVITVIFPGHPLSKPHPPREGNVHSLSRLTQL